MTNNWWSLDDKKYIKVKKREKLEKLGVSYAIKYMNKIHVTLTYIINRRNLIYFSTGCRLSSILLKFAQTFIL